MPKNTKKNVQPKDDSDEDLSDDLQAETDQGLMNEAIIKMLLEQSAGKKSSGSSKGFQTQKETRYNEARKRGKELVRDGIAFLEDAQRKLTDLKVQEISFEKYYQDYHLPLTVEQESVERAQMLYPPLIETLGLRRSDKVDDACNMLKNKGLQGKEAVKEFSKYARAQVDQVRQTEKNAADANALIMGYKALQQSK